MEVMTDLLLDGIGRDASLYFASIKCNKVSGSTLAMFVSSVSSSGTEVREWLSVGFFDGELFFLDGEGVGT
jgi:hypothetical protein